jgi:hypothetical protein
LISNGEKEKKRNIYKDVISIFIMENKGVIMEGIHSSNKKSYHTQKIEVLKE